MDGENQTSIEIDPNDNVSVYKAPFVDNYINSLGVADTYTYAPVVELFSPAGSGRTDYNTYGAPLQASAAGVIEVDVIKPEKSDYTWTAGGKTYRYYDVYLKVSTLGLPKGYQVAKVRAWRKIDSQYLGEREGINYDRLTLDANGEYKFVDKATCAFNEQLGDQVLGTSGNGAVCAGTFGAIDVAQGDVVPMNFVVRVYFTKTQGSKADNDQRYYIMETVIEDQLDNKIPTGINGVEAYRNVESVKYYNAAGVERDKPFQGVNIVVTRYSDGSTTTTKILK